MIKHVMLAAAFAVGLTSLAAAQAAPSPDAPPAPADQAPLPPGGDMPSPHGDMPPPPPGRGPHPEGYRRPPPPMTKGIEIRMGKDAGFTIECGDEPMAACLTAAKPLTDKIPDLVMPSGPSDVGGAPPPPAN